MIRLNYILALLMTLPLFGCVPEKKGIEPVPGQLTVEHSISTNAIHIGDPVELSLTAYYPTNGTLQLPELQQDKKVEVVNRNWSDEQYGNGLAKTEALFTITSFRVGDHLVSTNQIICKLDDGSKLQTPFPEILLRVESVLDTSATNATELADIKSVEKPPAKIPRWVWLIPLVGLIVSVIAFVAAKLFKNRPLTKPAAPPIPPHIIALKALEALQRKGWLDQDLCEPFYTELSLILREYLDGRFGLNAPDSTTEEIVLEMSSSKVLETGQQNILKEFMRQADMVKFAKGHPDRSTMEAAFNTTQQFVEETKNVLENGAGPSE